MDKQVQDWWEQAKADFKTAQDSISSKNYYASVAFSQQSAEKALKTVYILIFHKTPPKIHDLVRLGVEVKAPSTILSQAENLTGTYLSSRYPETAPEIPARYYTKEKAQTHLKEAEAILLWIEKRIK